MKELEQFRKLVSEQIRGRSRVASVTDRFIMFLVWMRHACSFHFFALLTGVSEGTCREYSLELISKSAKDYEERCEKAILFRNVFATIVVDGSEQQCSVPTQKIIEQSFYSGEKRKYSVTLLATAAPKDGHIYLNSESYQGSKSDQEMCEFQKIDFGKKLLRMNI